MGQSDLDPDVENELLKVEAHIEHGRDQNLLKAEQLRQLLQGDLSQRSEIELTELMGLIESLRVFHVGPKLEAVRRDCIRVLHQRQVVSDGGVSKARAH